ncbi:arsenic resistance N-acetyltransferase ArsN2 [Pleionea sediminis]|uniref:arsenic resistance N-acetyltransferase ArsN2 n=1 Tax=Pleionea sediminis TaxID=2569479 RepID=UPI001186C2C1|nr:arsenic resistance N-acetyltransferase ArsN2 [Pleionea sediminis]
MRILKTEYTDQVEALLNRSQLPTLDLQEKENIILIGAFENETVVGVIGLEIYQHEGVLRSLAVKPECRGQNIAGALLSELYIEAHNNNVQRLFLLTTTAERYFSKQGFYYVERDEVPEKIKQSSQFLSICPASAKCLVRDLSSKQ